MGAQDPPSSNIGDRGGVENQNRDQNAHKLDEFCTDDDVMIDNPQQRLHCVMCKLKGELKVTGRLIPFQVN
jgi:hypothetical protein